jgi:cytochrome c oxidase subunit 2
MSRRLLCCVALLASACSGDQSVLDPQGPAARNILRLTWIFFGLCIAVYVIVVAATMWASTRRRQESDDSPETTRMLLRAVTAASVTTVVLLTVLTVASEVAGRGLTSAREPGAMNVDVIGHQWWWDFRYHDATPSNIVNVPNELHIPVGVPVVLRFESRDVIHSFWVPNLHGKRDLIPGQVSQMRIEADRPGVYRGQCAEFCGHQHAHMAFVVVAEPMEQMQSWLQAQRRPAQEPSSDVQRRGQEVFLQSTCVTCHRVRGTNAGARFGPDLTHVASRRTLAAGTLPNTRGHLAGWIADSQSIKPGNRMPPNVLEAADLQAIVEYVWSLR